MPITLEQARTEVLHDPLAMIAQGENLLSILGVTTDPVEDPEQFLVDVHHQDPRHRDRFGNRRESVISRQQVAARAHSITDDDEIQPILSAADALGIMVPTYPFDDFALGVDAVLVTGGAKTAFEDRVSFALGLEMPDLTYIAGGSRPVTQDEKNQLEADGENPDNFKRELDLARLIAEKNNCKVFESSYADPDNLDVIREFSVMLRYGKQALITTQLYVSFTTADAGTAAAELGNKTAYRVYAGASDPEKVKARSVDIYRSEVMRTLYGAARWYREQVRRKLR